MILKNEIVQYQEHLDNIDYKQWFLNNILIKYNISKEDFLKYNNRFFYYIIKNNYKIINIDIYKYFFTFYDTYDYKNDLINNYCFIDNKVYKLFIDELFPKILNYIKTCPLFLYEKTINNNLYFKFIKGKIIKSLLTKNDFYYLKQFYDSAKKNNIKLNVFSSLLSHNLIKTKDNKIYVIDVKQIGLLDYQLNLPFCILLDNSDHSTAFLYTEKKNKNYNFSKLLKDHNLHKTKYIYY